MSFRRSSFCSTDHVTEQCVEVNILSRYVFVRSTNSETEVVFTHEEWEAFILGVKAGEFDLPEPTAVGSQAELPDHVLSATPRRPDEVAS